MTEGMFIAVVGPSGAGKDTLIDRAMTLRPDIVRARRVITRPPSPGTEDFESVSPAAFEALLLTGGLVLSWDAHGLSYGIPASTKDDLAAGRHVIANLSRRVWPEARTRFARCCLIWVTAPVDVLSARLTARGREDASDVEARLQRKTDAPPREAVLVDNGGAVEDGVAAFLGALPQPVRG